MDNIEYIKLSPQKDVDIIIPVENDEGECILNIKIRSEDNNELFVFSFSINSKCVRCGSPHSINDEDFFIIRKVNPDCEHCSKDLEVKE